MQGIIKTTAESKDPREAIHSAAKTVGLHVRCKISSSSKRLSSGNIQIGKDGYWLELFSDSNCGGRKENVKKGAYKKIFKMFKSGICIEQRRGQISRITSQRTSSHSGKLGSISQTKSNDRVTQMTEELNAVKISEEPIPDSNIGHKMLRAMGWTGGGLGKDETGDTVLVSNKLYVTQGRKGFGSD